MNRFALFCGAPLAQLVTAHAESVDYAMSGLRKYDVASIRKSPCLSNTCGDALLILLSSNSNTQYAHDILRVVALPKGARLTFRYEKRLVHNSVIRAVEGNAGLGGTEAVVIAVEQEDKTKPVQFRAVRFAKVLNVFEESGVFYADFIVDDFCAETVIPPPTCTPDQWKMAGWPQKIDAPSGRKAEGHYCLMDERNDLTIARAPSALVALRELAKVFLDWPVLREYPCLCVTAVSVYRKPGEIIRASQGMFSLMEKQGYELSLSHWLQKDAAGNNSPLLGSEIQLEVAPRGGHTPVLEHVTLLSHYDRHRMVFSTLANGATMLVLTVTPSVKAVPLRILLDCDTSKNWCWRTCKSAVIGFATASPVLAGVAAVGSNSTTNDAAVCALCWVTLAVFLAATAAHLFFQD